MEVLTDTEMERIDRLLAETMDTLRTMRDGIERTRRVHEGASQLVPASDLSIGDRIRVKDWPETVQNVQVSEGGVLLVVRTNCAVHGYCADEIVELVT